MRCASFKSPLAALRCRLYPFSEPRPAPPGPKFPLKLRPGGNPKCLEIFHNSRPVVRVRPAHMLHLWHTKVFGVVRPICYSSMLQPTSIIRTRSPSCSSGEQYQISSSLPSKLDRGVRWMDGCNMQASPPSPFPPPPQLKPLISPSSHFLVSQQPTTRAPLA